MASFMEKGGLKILSLSRMPGMKRVTTALVVMTLSAASAAAETPVAEVSRLQLYSSFWQNLHHFLYVSAWATRPVVPGQPRLAMPLPPGSDVSMAPDEKATWDHAVTVYERDFASRDLLFGQRMTMIKLGLVDRDDEFTGAPRRRRAEDAAAVGRADLPEVLVAGARCRQPHLDRRRGAPDDEVCARDYREADNALRRPLVRPACARRCRPLRQEPGRVHVEQSTHIVVASSDPGYAQWSSVEMLFHESSHGLFWKTQLAIEAAANRAGKMPRDLWHVVLFYIAGEVTRQELAKDGVEYKPYLYAIGLFDRAWPRFRSPVETSVQPYIDGKATLSRWSRVSSPRSVTMPKITIYRCSNRSSTSTSNAAQTAAAL